MTSEVLRDQRDYYEARAPEYEDALRRDGLYDRGPVANGSWRADMDELVHAFDAVPLDGDVLELAAGTGFWTERIVARADSLTVIDGSAGMIAENRMRLGTASARVAYHVADLFEWKPPREWDACVFGFWICHVPDERVAPFLETVAAALHPGGVVCFADKAALIDPSNELDERKTNDGRRFTIVNHPRPPDRLTDLFGAAGMDITVASIGQRFCLGRGTRR